MAKFNVLFVHNRKNKKLGRNQKSLVQARFTYKGRSRVFSTGFYLRESEWSKRLSKAKGVIDAVDINKSLRDIERRARLFFSSQSASGKTFTLEDLLRHMHRKDATGFIQYCKNELEEAMLEESTKKQDRIFIAYLESYQKDIPFNLLSTEFVKGFRRHMRKQKSKRDGKRLSEAYINSLLKKMKKYTNTLVATGRINGDPFFKWDFKTPPKERFALTQGQVNAIMNVDLSDRRPEVDIQRKAFVFRCYTGLAYADYQGLEVKHIDRSGDVWWIVKQRKKTKNKKLKPVQVPLNIFDNKAREIIEPFLKSKLPSARVFPSINCRDNNKTLKQIAKRSGIDEWAKVTTHVARHTFKDLLKKQGIRIEIIQELMGHSDVKVTQGYGTPYSREDILKNVI